MREETIHEPLVHLDLNLAEAEAILCLLMAARSIETVPEEMVENLLIRVADAHRAVMRGLDITAVEAASESEDSATHPNGLPAARSSSNRLPAARGTHAATGTSAATFVLSCEL